MGLEAMNGGETGQKEPGYHATSWQSRSDYLWLL